LTNDNYGLNVLMNSFRRNSTSRQNGSVGGEITKRLVQAAEQQFGGQQ